MRRTGTRSRTATGARAWQRMLSGRRLDLLDPSPLDIEIADISHGLARVARWNGQTSGHHAFSVAQHTLLVDDIVGRLQSDAPPEIHLITLLHDAPEYVIGDMISPFKAIMGGDYKKVEKRLEEAVHLRFGLAPATPGALKALIKRADRISAFFEATELAGFSEGEAAKLFGRPRGISRDMVLLDPLPATDVQGDFVRRFEELEALRGHDKKRA